MKTKQILTKKEVKEFKDIITWAMNTIDIDSEEAMNMYSTLSITLLKACTKPVERQDIDIVYDIIKTAKLK